MKMENAPSVEPGTLGSIADTRTIYSKFSDAPQTDPVRDFLDAMRAAGCNPADGSVIADDKLHRFRIEGTRIGNTSGAYQVKVDHDGFAYGWFMDWREGVLHPWHNKTHGDCTAADFDRIEAAKLKAAAASAEAVQEAVQRAQERWDKATLDGASVYLDRKQVGAHGIRFQGADILVPVTDGETVMSLQAISPSGNKKFMPGCPISGGYFPIMGDPETIAIAEGYATAASVHMATGWTSVVAFNAGNLPKVAGTIRAKFPGAAIVICGDADASGTGKRYGDEAAAVARGRAVYPPSGDWNDIHCREGLQAVCAALDDPLTVCVASLHGLPIPDRKWLVQEMIPSRQVTLLYGDGGTGKSLLALQLAVAVALRGKRELQSWLGLPVLQGKAIYLGAEDEQDELLRRLSDIVAAESATFEDLADLQIRSLAGEDALLATEEAHKPLKPSDLYERVRRELKRYGPELLVLDTLADMYPASEIDRAKVRQFVGLLKKLAQDYDCAIVMLAHPSKAGMESGRGDSGSTAWNGSVRSRLYLQFPKAEDGLIDPDTRILESKKLNYGRTGAALNLEWRSGVFAPKPGDTVLSRAATTAKAERVYLELLRQYTEVGNAPSLARAAAAFARDDDNEGVRKSMFVKAQTALLKAGKIIIETDKRGTKRIVAVVK